MPTGARRPRFQPPAKPRPASTGGARLCANSKREVSERVATDWLKLKTEYLQTEISLRALAEKNGVSARQLGRVAAGEGWAAARRAGRGPMKPAMPDTKRASGGKATGGKNPPRRAKPVLGTVDVGAPVAKAKRAGPAERSATKRGVAPPARAEPATPPDPDTLARLRAISEQLTSQLALAAGQLDKQVLKHRRKTRELVYENGEPRGKPVEETVNEHCELEIVDVPVSTEGLKRLSTTLKNLNDIVKAGGGDEQSVGMVAALMKKLDAEAMKEDA